MPVAKKGPSPLVERKQYADMIRKFRAFQTAFQKLKPGPGVTDTQGRLFSIFHVMGQTAVLRLEESLKSIGQKK